MLGRHDLLTSRHFRDKGRVHLKQSPCTFTPNHYVAHSPLTDPTLSFTCLIFAGPAETAPALNCSSMPRCTRLGEKHEILPLRTLTSAAEIRGRDAPSPGWDAAVNHNQEMYNVVLRRMDERRLVMSDEN
jgi:hypothetical protein